ncbi:MAG: trigger factor [Alphaproteobacteria bacterium]|nr:trigger factor [Alphaproteobacteria bacterium]
MKITEVKSEGLKKEYQVVVPAAEFEAKIDAKIKQISKNAKLPGFRAGKAPFEMLKKKYHDSVMGEVVEDAVRDGSNEVIKSNNLRPATQPDVKITAFSAGKDLEFSVSLENLPEIKLGDFSKIKLDKFMAEVPAEEVEKALNYIAESHKETVVVEGKKAAKGDVVIIDFVGSIDGVEFQGGKGSNYPLELGSGSFIPGFEDQLIGAEAGSHIDVNVKFPDTYHAKDLAGKDSVFAVDVKEVREPKKVEINDEFAKSAGAESLDKLREDIKNRIKNDYENASRMKIKRQLLDALDKEYNFASPESLVEAEYKAIVEQYEQAKKYNQLDEAEKAKSEKDLLKEYKEIALRRVKLGLLLSEVGQDAKISIKPEDINAAIMNEAKKYPGQEKMVFDYYLKNKAAVDGLKAPIFEEKIVDYIISKASVTEKTVSVEELYNFSDDTKPAKKTAAKKETKAEKKSA